MKENLRSILLGTSALTAAAVVAIFLAATRHGFKSDRRSRDKVINLLLAAISLQCLHFTEEFLTHFNERFPQRFGLPAWSNEFFVAFNLFWIAVWILAAIGVRANVRLAFFPVWFLIIGMVINGIAHPLLAIAAGGYFPGLWTSPLVGLLGLILGLNVWRFTS